jgi:hypothetical protein
LRVADLRVADLRAAALRVADLPAAALRAAVLPAAAADFLPVPVAGDFLVVFGGASLPAVDSVAIAQCLTSGFPRIEPQDASCTPASH